MKMISTTTIPEITLEEISSFHSKLVSQRAVQLYVLDEFAANFVPPDLPTPITEIFNAGFLNKPFETVLAEIDRLLQTDLFTVTANQSESVQKLTKGQTKAKLWNIYRSGLCTASKSHTICHTNIVKPSTSLLKSNRYPADNIFSTEATRYGIENETKCLKKGICWLRERNLHPSFTVTKCGLILSTSFLGMAASPDSLFVCECHGRCVVEVKCSWKHRNAASLSQVALDNNDFCLMYDCEEEAFFFKKNHPYFYHIQHQMIVCDCTYGIFMMFIEKDICVISIPFDKVVADEIISKTHKYMRQVMLPQLLCEHYVKSNNVSELSLKENVIIELVISDLNVEVPSVTEMGDAISGAFSAVITKESRKTAWIEITAFIAMKHPDCPVKTERSVRKKWNNFETKEKALIRHHLSGLNETGCGPSNRPLCNLFQKYWEYLDIWAEPAEFTAQSADLSHPEAKAKSLKRASSTVLPFQSTRNSSSPNSNTVETILKQGSSCANDGTTNAFAFDYNRYKRKAERSIVTG
ncbi:Uncharacterized protein APZ42_032963 [Daphnia magna]|uniref:YqaJ viral recombinase domain-containing protein n=1 Tax=Daphnia magna TaxID=35525 RepID=A0A164LIH8_9CRUS|nr:Uncharacterized protein APZ42_032963 [Daphnia magna]